MAKVRLHKSSIVVAVIATAVAVLLEVPGRVVRGTLGDAQTTEFEHGWPWVYLRRETFRQVASGDLRPERREERIADFYNYDLDVRRNLPLWSVPWLSKDNWMLGEVNRTDNFIPRDFRAWALLADVLIVFVLILIAVATWEWRRRRRLSCLSFALADLFIAMTAVCMLLGWLLYLDREFKREEQITNSSEDSPGWLVTDETCIAPLWIQSLASPQLLPQSSWRASAVRFYVDEETNDKPLKEIAALRYVTAIEIETLEDKRFAFSKLRIIKHLRTLDLSNYSISENDIDELAQLTSLRKLIIEHPNDIAADVSSRLETALPHCKIVEFDDDW